MTLFSSARFRRGEREYKVRSKELVMKYLDQVTRTILEDLKLMC